MYGSHPWSAAEARGQTAVAPDEFGVFKAQVRAVGVGNGVEPGINPRLKSRELVLPGHADMQMGMQGPLAVVGHQDFHLANGQVLDVLILRPSIFNIRFTAKPDGLVPVFKYS